MEGLVCGFTLKLKVSCSRDHWIPRARSAGAAFRSRLRGSDVTALSVGSTESRTDLLFELNLCRRKPPLLHNSRASAIVLLCFFYGGDADEPIIDVEVLFNEG